MVILDYFVRLPALTAYVAYDKATALYFNWKQLFQGWGIHLYVGKFGAGKTSLMVTEAYKLCCNKYQAFGLSRIYKDLSAKLSAGYFKRPEKYFSLDRRDRNNLQQPRFFGRSQQCSEKPLSAFVSMQKAPYDDTCHSSAV